MGREAVCHCQWGSDAGSCKVLLETNDMILRGSFHRNVPIAALTHVRQDEDRLCFSYAEEEVALTLGASRAQNWAKKMTTPPPSLAEKLGIAENSSVLLLGASAPPEIKAALAKARAAHGDPALIIAAVNSSSDLHLALDRYPAAVAPPLWIVYAKGSGHPIGEAKIRQTLRSAGFVDTKVCSVSPTHTALKFIRRP